MTYEEQYDIATGIFNTFNKGLKRKTMKVNHGQKKRDSLKSIFPYKKYEKYTREVFILACLHISFNRMPSSVTEMYTELNNIEMSDIQTFRDSISQYRKYLKDDLETLITLYGTNVSLEQITSEYRNKSIKWYTWYFYLLVSNSEEEVMNSRVNGILYAKVKSLLLFVSFSEKSIQLTNRILSKNLSLDI